jgi:hypothetical protein
MSTPAIGLRHAQREPAVQLRRRWRRALGRLRSQVRQRAQVRTECFGRLTDKDEMVVAGLAVRPAFLSEGEQRRW